MSQKSGLEILQDILNKVELLDKRFIVIEQNMKNLLNKANDFEQKQEQKLLISPIEQKPSILPVEEEQQKASTKVIGTIKTKNNRLVIGADVTITKEDNIIVKQTKTNRAGEWMCFLSPGKYQAKYYLEKIIDTSVEFKVIKDQTQVRVAQPKWSKNGDITQSI